RRARGERRRSGGLRELRHPRAGDGGRRHLVGLALGHRQERDVAEALERPDVPRDDLEARALVDGACTLVELGDVGEDAPRAVAPAGELEPAQEELQAEPAADEVGAQAEPVVEVGRLLLEVVEADELAVRVERREVPLWVFRLVDVAVVEVVRRRIAPRPQLDVAFFRHLRDLEVHDRSIGSPFGNPGRPALVSEDRNGPARAVCTLTRTERHPDPGSDTVEPPWRWVHRPLALTNGRRRFDSPTRVIRWRTRLVRDSRPALVSPRTGTAMARWCHTHLTRVAGHPSPGGDTEVPPPLSPRHGARPEGFDVFIAVRFWPIRVIGDSERRRPLLDAPQHRRLPLQLVGAVELTFVPPRSAGLGQRCEHVPRLRCFGRAGTAEDDLERRLGPLLALLPDVRDQVTHLVDGRC